MRDFSGWKAYAIAKLNEIFKKALENGNEKLANDCQTLITKLQYLRLRDLAGWMALVHHAYQYHKLKELLDILPSAEEVQKWIG